MITRKDNKQNILYTCLMLIIFSFFLTACPQPVTNPSLDTGTKTDPPTIGEASVEVICYLANEVIFHNFDSPGEENYGLFCTTVYITSPAPAIPEDFSFVLDFPGPLIQYESIISQQALLTDVNQDSGPLSVKGTIITPAADKKTTLFTVTWKATATAITEGKLNVISLHDSNGQLLKTASSISIPLTIVEKAGSLSFAGPTSVKKETTFSNTILLDAGGKFIKDYDWEITYDPAKLALIDTEGAPGVQADTDGFLASVTLEPGKIHVTGNNPNGLGPDKDYKFLKLNWSTLTSGRTTISITTHRTETLDNVLIKPEIWPTTISIYKDTNKPIVDVHLDPAALQISKNSTFTTSVIVNTTGANTTGYVLATYTIDILYDPTVIELDSTKPFEAGKDGFYTVGNPNLAPGIARVVGFDISGKAPNPQMELFKIHWLAKEVSAASKIRVDVINMSDIRTEPIDFYRTEGSTVTVTEN